jgi:hypothetical protein
MKRLGWFLALPLLAAQWAAAASLDVPAHIVSGQELTIGTHGSGSATLYLFGPASAAKHTIKLGEPVKLAAEELSSAGRYVVIVNDESASFFAVAGPVATLAFIARPSRVPAANHDVVSGTAFVFDHNRNLVLSPQPVTFTLTVEGAPPVARSEQSRDGVAWTRLDSSRRAGAAQFIASTGQVSVRRVVQEVAGEPCNLRLHAQNSRAGLLVETDPIRDCAGNPVPDGTIVTFTSIDSGGRTTIDARIKRGIARAELPAAGTATISAASGVVLGNEIRWGGR